MDRLILDKLESKVAVEVVELHTKLVESSLPPRPLYFKMYINDRPNFSSNTQIIYFDIFYWIVKLYQFLTVKRYKMILLSKRMWKINGKLKSIVNKNAITKQSRPFNYDYKLQTD